MNKSKIHSREPYRRSDLRNAPRTEARERFLDEWAKYQPDTFLDEVVHLWNSLPPAAKQLASLPEGTGVLDVLPGVQAGESHELPAGHTYPELYRLCTTVRILVKGIGVTPKGNPPSWVVATIVETLKHCAERHECGKKPRWVHPITLQEEYPAEEKEERKRWVAVSTRMPIAEQFHVLVEIHPKQLDENEQKFRNRFNETCRIARERYIEELRQEGWTSKPFPEMLNWIDKLAQWQAGRSSSRIDPSIKSPAARSKFSLGIARAADFIGITPRKSKHHPQRLRTLAPPKQ